MASLHNLKRNAYGQLIKKKTLADNLTYLIANSDVKDFIHIAFIQQTIADSNSDLDKLSLQISDGIKILTEVLRYVQNEKKCRHTEAKVSYLPNVLQ